MKILSSIKPLVLSGLVLLLLCSCNKETGKRNVILISLDTQRADFLSCYDSTNAATPFLDALAQDGVVYENCFSYIPITLPSHTSIFYSCLPQAVKVYNNGENVLPQPSKPGIVEIFKNQGYKTAAFVSMGVLQAAYGLNRGFDEYVGTFPQNGRYYLNAAEVNAAVLPWLDQQQKEQEYFLWVHYSDPHDPYYPATLAPELEVFHNDHSLGEFHLNETQYKVAVDLIPGENIFRFEVTNNFSRRPKKRQARLSELKLEDLSDNTQLDFDSLEGINRRNRSRFLFCDKIGTAIFNNRAGSEPARLIFRGKKVMPEEAQKRFYQEEVEYMDRHIGELLGHLKKRGLYKKSLIVVVGDHGEGLGEYLLPNGLKHFGHIQYLNDVYMRVPLLLYAPGEARPETRIKAPVCLLDLAPTIMHLSGLKPVRHFVGINIWSKDLSSSRGLEQATFQPEAVRSRFSIRQYPWHLIFTPADKQFELFELSSDPKEKINVFEKFQHTPEIKKLQRRLEISARDSLINRQTSQLDEKTEEMLKALGYIR